MPKSRKRKKKPHKLANPQVDIYEPYVELAMEQAKLVPWPRLVAAVDQYNEWETFTLWVRAVVDAAHTIPPLVQQEIERRIPGFAARVEGGLRSTPEDKRGDRLRELMMNWVEINIFLEPQAEDWYDAILHFSTYSLPYMKARAHWELVDVDWRDHPPTEWPTYEHWQTEVAGVSQLPGDVDENWQRSLNAMRSIPAAEWDRMWLAFLDLTAFCLWMQLILDVEGLRSPLVLEEIRAHYPGFSLTNPDWSPIEAMRALQSWGARRIVGDDDQVMGSLAWQMRHHGAYNGISNYAEHCHDLWATERRSPLPSFDEWRRSSETFRG